MLAHQPPNQAMQPTTLWRCVPMLALARLLSMRLCAPARVVADLESRQVSFTWILKLLPALLPLAG